MTPDIYFIFLKHLKVDASIGIHDFERDARQSLWISVALILPRRTDPSDDIGTVIDYDFIRDQILDLTATRHWDLQESLCEAIADHCVSKPGVLGAVVKTAKPDVYPDTVSVGCHLARLSADMPPDFAWWTLDL